MASETEAVVPLRSAAQIRVFDRSLGQQGRLGAGTALRAFAQPEAGLGVFSRRHLLERDQEIEIAARRVEAADRGRAEQVEPAHAEAAAQFGDVRKPPRGYRESRSRLVGPPSLR